MHVNRLFKCEITKRDFEIESDGCSHNKCVLLSFLLYFLFRVILDARNDCYHCTRGPCSFYSNQLLLLLPMAGLEAQAK